MNKKQFGIVAALGITLTSTVALFLLSNRSKVIPDSNGQSETASVLNGPTLRRSPSLGADAIPLQQKAPTETKVRVVTSRLQPVPRIELRYSAAIPGPSSGGLERQESPQIGKSDENGELKLLVSEGGFLEVVSREWQLVRPRFVPLVPGVVNYVEVEPTMRQLVGLVDEAGKPLTGWKVSILHPLPEETVGLTDQSGRAALPKGRIPARMFPVWDGRSRVALLTLAERSTADATMTVPSAELTTSLHMSSGSSPIAEAVVSPGSRDSGIRIPADDHGDVLLQYAAPAVTVVVSAPEYWPRWVQLKGESHREVGLDSTSSRRFQVVTEAGVPVPDGLRVNVLCLGPAMYGPDVREQELGGVVSSGILEVDGLPNDSCQATMWCNTKKVSFLSRMALPRAEQDQPKIVVASPRRFNLSMVDISHGGRPLSGPVTVSVEPSTERLDKTDDARLELEAVVLGKGYPSYLARIWADRVADGRLAIEVPSAREDYAVEVLSADGAYGTTHIAPRSGGGTIDLGMRSLTEQPSIRVRMEWSDGKPCAQCVVKFTNDTTGVEAGSVITDSAGVLILSAPSGYYRASYSSTLRGDLVGDHLLDVPSTGITILRLLSQ